MGTKSRISEHIQSLLQFGNLEKAGTWQATDDYKDFNMLVLRNFDKSYPVPESIEDMALYTGADLPWADEHFDERISGDPSNPGESYKNWPYNTFKPEADPYMHGKEFSHTYQERFWPKQAGDNERIVQKGIRYHYGDLGDVIIQLNHNPLTRQAFLPIFFPEDTGAVHKQRVPCTLGYLFNIYGGKLYCNYYIRSCDAFRHFRNDIYLAMRLMDHIRNSISENLLLGDLNMYIAHFHVFENDRFPLNKKERKLNE